MVAVLFICQTPHFMLCVQVGQWLQANDLAMFVAVFGEWEITGALLHQLKDSELKEFVCQEHVQRMASASLGVHLGDAKAAYQAVP